MPSAFDATATPRDVLLDTAFLYVGTTPLGVSRGGLSYDPGTTYRNIDFDGKRSPIAGLDRVTARNPTITGRLLQLGPADILRFEPASAAVVATDTTTTPVDASTTIAVASLITDLRIIWRRGGGGYFAARFSRAMCTRWSVSGGDNSEAEIDCAFEARLNVTGGVNTDDSPVVYEHLAALPA